MEATKPWGKIFPFRRPVLERPQPPTLNCSQCPESQNPSGTVSELSSTSCPLNESYLDMYLSGNNSLNVARAIVHLIPRMCSMYCCELQVLPACRFCGLFLSTGLQGCVLQLPARLCNSVYSPSHSGLYYMGHNSIIYNSSSKSDWFSPWTLEYLLWSTKGWGSVLLENMQPSPSDCDQFFSSGFEGRRVTLPTG